MEPVGARLSAVLLCAGALSLPAAATPAPAPDRLASHLFLAAGKSRSVAGLGRLLETIHLTRPAAVAVEGSAVRALRGGISCLRFRYREQRDENGVQTLCVVAFDETGSCAGKPRLRLDLEARAGRPREGNADLLESGASHFYATCRAGRAYRLERTSRALPPLYLTIVDALGDGPYSLGDSELARLRASAIATFSGRLFRPPWILTVGSSAEGLALRDDGTLDFVEERCGRTPWCSARAALVRPGDIVRIGVGATQETFERALADAPEAARDRFFRARSGLGWAEIAAADPGARRVAFARLAVLDLMHRLLRRFDRLYGLRSKRVAIGYWQHWLAQDELTHLCLPNPAEQERCRRIEAALQAEEARRVAGWREDGYRLWYATPLEYRPGGEVRRVESLRPSVALFEGVLAGLAANASVTVPDVPGMLRQLVRDLAGTARPDLPVVLHLNGPPLRMSTGGPRCEADICPADFRGAFEQGEAVLDEALRAFAPGQLRGFGVALFDGSHFDIRHPYERFTGFSLNRAGETGFDSPVLNVYRAL